MPKKQVDLQPVEPLPDDGPVSRAAVIFQDIGWPEKDLRWLPTFVLSILPRESVPEDALGGVTEMNLKFLASAWADATDAPRREWALFKVFARLCGGCGRPSAPYVGRSVESVDGLSVSPEPWSPSREQAREIARTFRTNGVDFERLLIERGSWPEDYGTDEELRGPMLEYAKRGPHPALGTPKPVLLMQFLHDSGAVRLPKILNWEAMAAEAMRPTVGEGPAALFALPNANDTRSLALWTIACGVDILPECTKALDRDLPDDTLAAAATGIRRVISTCALARHGHWTYLREFGQDLAAAVTPLLDMLERRSSAQGTARPVRRAWLWFSLAALEADYSSLDAGRREKLLRVATDDVAQLRRLLQRAAPVPTDDVEHFRQRFEVPGKRTTWDEFEQSERDHLETCLSLLFNHGGIWRGLKPMLLAWRALSSPAVTEDLRYWTEQGLEPPPACWDVIVAWPMNLTFSLLQREAEKDPGLLELRTELCRFCLDRLADHLSEAERRRAEDRKRTDDDMVEKSPIWRLCLVRAAAALRINPAGKGHHVLFHASEHDPDERVREYARQACQQLRRLKHEDESEHPMRDLVTSLWWIRQAHLLGLGEQPHPDRANRTRTKELDRVRAIEAQLGQLQPDRAQTKP